jgi:hypothetical protein
MQRSLGRNWNLSAALLSAIERYQRLLPFLIQSSLDIRSARNNGAERYLTICVGIRAKISQYLEKLSSAGHGDAEELTFYGLAYLRILHEEPDPRYTGCWVIRHVLVIAAFAIDAYAFSDRYADYAMQQGRLFSIPPTSELKNGKESREEVCKVDSEEAYPRRVHQSWRAWTARSLESANTRVEDCERNEAVRRIAAAESRGAWYWARPSPLNGWYNHLNDCSSEINSRSSLVHLQLPTVSHVLKFHRRIPWNLGSQLLH